MKKVLVFLLLLLSAGAFWRNRTYFTPLLYATKRTPASDFLIKESERFRIHYLPGGSIASRIGSISAEFDDRIGIAERALGRKFQGPLKLYLYDTFEQKGAHVRLIPVAHAEPSAKTIYAIINKNYNGLKEGLEYEILLHQIYGEAVSGRWSRAAAASFSGVWNQKSLEDWRVFLSQRSLQPSLQTLLIQEPSASEFIIYPWSAIVAKFLSNKYGINSLELLYRSGRLPLDFEARWEESLRAESAEQLPERREFDPVFQKGVSYAYWNSLDAGYPTQKSKKSLGLLKRNGVDWIASIPYGFMRDHDSTKVRKTNHSIGTESDESMFELANHANEMGIKVMLKPQIWISHDAWPGKINMQSQEDWNAWFASYEDWIIHYAIIAELSNAKIFCIGTEMVQTTLNHPQKWSNLIAKIRKVYRGPLVYAANWGKEFEEISFWDELDYMGLDNYYPVRSSTDEDVAMIEEGFKKQKEKLSMIVKRWNKPLIFTEIGYMAMQGAGMGSREEEYPRYDERLQQECYRMALKTYWNEPWFSGMYWWKWFSNPDDSGRRADPHSPHGRPAEKVIAEYYTSVPPTTTGAQ